MLCVAVCLLLTTNAMAQRRGGFGGMFGGGGYTFLIGNEKIQAELKLTDKQKSDVNALREELMAAAPRGGFGGGRNASPEEREKAQAEFRKRTEENNKKFEALLNADQVKRIKELSLQQRLQFGGYAVLADPEVAKALNFSVDQQNTVKMIAEASQARMREMFQGGGFDREKADELRKNADKEYLAVLKDDQKKQLETMQGAKFEFDPPQFGGGRRGN
jgi:hypothetical protein